MSPFKSRTAQAKSIIWTYKCHGSLTITPSDFRPTHWVAESDSGTLIDQIGCADLNDSAMLIIAASWAINRDIAVTRMLRNTAVLLALADRAFCALVPPCSVPTATIMRAARWDFFEKVTLRLRSASNVLFMAFAELAFCHFRFVQTRTFVMASISSIDSVAVATATCTKRLVLLPFFAIRARVITSALAKGFPYLCRCLLPFESYVVRYLLLGTATVTSTSAAASSAGTSSAGTSSAGGCAIWTTTPAADAASTASTRGRTSRLCRKRCRRSGAWLIAGNLSYHLAHSRKVIALGS